MEWKKLKQVILRVKGTGKGKNEQSWVDLWNRHIINGIDSTDDMLFYVKSQLAALTSADESMLSFHRIESVTKPTALDKLYNWEETFFLNLLLHQFNYTMTCAVCEQKKPGKDLKVYRSFSVPVYGTPNKHTMYGKAKETTISYPNIYFSVFNFDEAFDGIVLTENEMVCVELIAVDQAETVQVSVFLGSIRYEILKSTLENRASLKSKFLKQITLGMHPGLEENQFITMNGPRGRGRVEMCVSAFKPDINKDFVVSFDREADLLEREVAKEDSKEEESVPGVGASRTKTQSVSEPYDRRMSSNTRANLVNKTNNWTFKPKQYHHYVKAQLTYLTLRWDELLDDLLECKKRPLLGTHTPS